MYLPPANSLLETVNQEIKASYRKRFKTFLKMLPITMNNLKQNKCFTVGVVAEERKEGEERNTVSVYYYYALNEAIPKDI